MGYSKKGLTSNERFDSAILDEPRACKSASRPREPLPGFTL